MLSNAESHRTDANATPTPPRQGRGDGKIDQPRRLLPARSAMPLPPHAGDVRRWRLQQVRRMLRQEQYNEDAALDGAMEKLAMELGVSLED